MRRRGAGAGVAAALAVWAALACPPVHAAPANRIIARVNDRIATLYDYEMRLDDAMRRSRDLPDDPADREDYVSELSRDVMRDIFEELLILSRADQLSITITAADINDALNRMRESNGLQDDDQFRAALAQAGLTPEMLRAQFEQQIRYQRVIGREVYSEIHLEEEDLRRYYKDHQEEFRRPEEVKLREVVVLDDTGASTAAAAAAASLAVDLRGGKPLEELIAAAPEGSLSNVIELGWVEKGDLDAALEQAVWGLEPGSWSAPTRGRGGIHLAQVQERRESTIPTFKEVEEDIRRREERSRLDARMKEYLAELEKKSYLYLDPPPAAAGFRSSTGETPGGSEFPFKVPEADGASAADTDDEAADDAALDDQDDEKGLLDDEEAGDP